MAIILGKIYTLSIQNLVRNYWWEEVQFSSRKNTTYEM